MGRHSARENDSGQSGTADGDCSSDQTGNEGRPVGQPAEQDSPGSTRRTVRSGSVQTSTVGGVISERNGAVERSSEGHVNHDSSYDPEALSARYGIAVRRGEVEKLGRLEREFGPNQVSRWANEGMTVDTMGKSRDMRAFRNRQEARSDGIPTDIERQNEASKQRNVNGDREDGPAGETGVPDVLRRVVSSPGRSMDETVQREMETKMGGDFSDVRIHTGPRAAAAADAIGARAFTVGNHVAFNEGEHRPDTEDGKQVLAHELTHVRQQTEGAVSLLPEADADRPVSPVVGGAPVHVQPKLKVSSPDDPAEKEAEEVAAHVVQMNDPSTEPEIDRETADRKPALFSLQEVPRAVGESEGASDSEPKVRSGVQGGGKPLPSATRSEFESKMGTDFSDVRVHTGRDADEGAKSIHARAYTIGSDIAFARGNFDPGSSDGKRLLAHELTHVAQQAADANRQNRILRQSQESEGGGEESGGSSPGEWEVIEKYREEDKRKYRHRIDLGYQNRWMLGGQSLGIDINAYADLFPELVAELKDLTLTFNGSAAMTISGFELGPKDVSKLDFEFATFTASMQSGGRQTETDDMYAQLRAKVKLLAWLLGKVLTNKSAKMEGDTLAPPGEKEPKTYEDATPEWLTVDPTGTVGAKFRFGEGGNTAEVHSYTGEVGLELGAALASGTKATLNLNFAAETIRGEGTQQLQPSEESVTSASVSGTALGTISVLGYSWDIGGSDEATATGTRNEFLQFRSRGMASGMLRTMEDFSPQAVRDAETKSEMEGLVTSINANFIGNAGTSLDQIEELFSSEWEYASPRRIVGSNNPLVNEKSKYAGYRITHGAEEYLQIAIERDPSIKEFVKVLSAWAPPGAVKAPWADSENPQETETWNLAHYWAMIGRPTLRRRTIEWAQNRKSPHDGGLEAAQAVLDEINYILDNYSEQALKEMGYLKWLQTGKKRFQMYQRSPRQFNEAYDWLKAQQGDDQVTEAAQSAAGD